MRVEECREEYTYGLDHKILSDHVILILREENREERKLDGGESVHTD